VTRPGQAGPDSQTAVFYAEDHCALRWPLLTAGLYAPLLAVVLIAVSLAVGKGPLYWVVFAFFMFTVLVWVVPGQLLPYVWPTGIRLDSRGVRIGGMRWAERNPGRTRKATVPWQYAQVFACPWEGVHRIGVTTDRKAIRVMIRGACHGLRPTPLGNLAAPFMRAALVIWVERDHAELPEIKRARGPLSVNWSSPGFHQPIWIAPTRHRQRLEAALATVPLPAGTVSDPYEYANVDQQMSEWSAP
jgi:hypothetical protein